MAYKLYMSVYTDWVLLKHTYKNNKTTINLDSKVEIFHPDQFEPLELWKQVEYTNFTTIIIVVAPQDVSNYINVNNT